MERASNYLQQIQEEVKQPKVSNYDKFWDLYNQCRKNGWTTHLYPNDRIWVQKMKSLDNFVRVIYCYQRDIYSLITRNGINAETKTFPTFEDIAKYLQPEQTSLFDIETNY